MRPVLGVIADDLTGATDVANTLVKRGMTTVQAAGPPDDGFDPGDAQAIVIALKSRTCAVSEAIADSLQALRWLAEKGANQFLFKYCSTFDSTSDGNIGPVADSLLDELGAEFAFVCPASPENGRSIYNGHLFVGDQLLSESPMRHHPLTPMYDSSLIRLMNAQSEHSCGLIDIHTVRKGPEAISAAARRLIDSGHRYGVTDAIDEGDLETIGAATAGHRLITGAAGMAIGLPANLGSRGEAETRWCLPDIDGRCLVLAGSCSAATRNQIAEACRIWPNRKLDIHLLAKGPEEIARTVDWAASQPADTPVLIYGSSDPEEVRENQQKYGTDTAGELIETGLASIARQLALQDFTRMIVAGGETSGAVVAALQIRGLRIGSEIEPGVPWTETIGGRPTALALKSGNFGSPDFFANAFGMLP